MHASSPPPPTHQLSDNNYSSARCLALPLTAARASLPTVAGTAALLDLLPADMATTYATPAALLRPPGEAVKAPHAVMCASRADYVGVVKKLCAIGMVAWTRTPDAG